MGTANKCGRVYVCHTYYHAYVSFLKELKLRAEGEKEQATLVLSTMSNNFEDFPNRVKQTGLFADVVLYDEKKADFFPELTAYTKDTGSFMKNLLQRIKFTKRFARLQEAYVPVDFKSFRDIYVYCDSDPIGFYLNQHRIHYHAMEDGLNCLKNYDAARYDNRGHFGIKAFLSMRLNLIFVQNGWGKYCMDMEVNDIASIPNPCPRYIELPRKTLTERLTDADKDVIITAFIRDKEALEDQLCGAGQTKDNILILTDPLCDLATRERIFRDLVTEYQKQGTVFLKPHPRDELDYRALFGDVPQFDATVPMELLGYFPGVHFAKVIGVLTEMKGITYADEAIRLGPDFMDKYEDPKIHRQNEQIY